VSQLQNLSAQAIQLQDGTVYFAHPPTLKNAVTTERRVTSSGATYYFTLDLPEDAGEPLQRIVINQKDGSTYNRLVKYRTEDTRAFTGTYRQRGEALPVQQTTFDQATQTVTVTFDAPVPPGTTVTIGLRPQRNPQMDGIYLFGVTAFPQGEKSYGQFIGYGRLQFDAPSNDILFP
jgi:hypothetical protein